MRSDSSISQCHLKAVQAIYDGRLVEKRVGNNCKSCCCNVPILLSNCFISRLLVSHMDSAPGLTFAGDQSGTKNTSVSGLRMEFQTRTTYGSATFSDSPSGAGGKQLPNEWMGTCCQQRISMWKSMPLCASSMALKVGARASCGLTRAPSSQSQGLEQPDCIGHPLFVCKQTLYRPQCRETTMLPLASIYSAFREEVPRCPVLFPP